MYSFTSAKEGGCSSIKRIIKILIFIQKLCAGLSKYYPAGMDITGRINNKLLKSSEYAIIKTDYKSARGRKIA